MERIQVNAAGAMDGCYPSTEENNRDQFEKGQVVEGVITKISDTISITLNGKELQVSQSAVPNAKEGQVRTFEITDISKQSIVIKEVGNEAEGSVSSGIKQTTVAAGTATFVGKGTKETESLELTKDKVKKQISNTLNRLSEADCREMEKETTPLEEYNEDRFERMLDRIKKQRQFKTEHREQEVTKKQEAMEDLEEATKDIRKRLQEEDLPATDTNIAKVATAMELAAMSATMTDASKAYMIDNSLSVTPENIYKSTYSGTVSTSSTMTDSTWQELQPRVEELLVKEGMEADEKTISDAKWLLQNDLSITKDTIATLGQLNDFGEELDVSLIRELCIKNLAEGGEPKATDFVAQNEDLDCIKKAKDSVIMLENIKDSAIHSLEEGEPVTLEALSLVSENREQSLRTDIQAITAKRQLEEVRLKLTMESSYQLYKQGIAVDTMELSNLIEELKALEDAYYKGLSYEFGIEADENDIRLLKATDQMISGLRRMPATILGSTFDQRMSISMDELYAEGERGKASYLDPSSEYETLMTVPRKDLGDSIKKAFAGIDNILKDLKMEQSESNERAVRILAYNQMEIKEESITDMKSYDLQVNQLMEKLTPEVALTLIHEGKNPIDVPIHELTELVDHISSSIGKTSEEKFSEYLYNLDKKNEITSDERDSYIGIYRLLHQVQKSDGAAVGAVVKAGKELTLGNLLTAVRSEKQSGMDIEVDQTFGGVERMQQKGSSISDQVSKAFYGKQLVKEAFDGLSVDAVAALNQEKENLLDVTVEQLHEKERAINADGSSEDLAANFEKIRNILSTSQYSDVLVSAEVEVTVNNLEAAQYLLPNTSSIYKEMKEKVSLADERLGSHIRSLYDNFYERLGEEDRVQDGYQELKEVVKEATGQFMDSAHITAEEINELRIYQNAIRLAGKLSSSQMFELPVTVGEDVVTMKIQMVSSTEEQSKVSIHMEEETKGAFDMTANVENGSLSAFVICDNREVTKYYKEQEETLRNELEQLGVSLKQLSITMNRKKTEFYDTSTGKNDRTVPTEVLYNVAKLFVAATKKAFE